MSEEMIASTTAAAPVDTNPPTSAPADNARSVTGTIQSSADGAARIAAAIAAANKTKAAAPKPEAPKVEAAEAAEAAAEGEETAPELEAAKPKADDSPDYRKRIRIREQQFRREAAEASQAAEQDRQAAAQARAEVEKTRSYYQRLEHMRVNDPVGWLNETKMDLEPIVRSKIEANKPEARATQAEAMAKQAIDRLEAMERQAQQREQQAYKAETERRFATLVSDEDKYPTVTAVYADDAHALVQAAYSVQSQFQAQHGRLPTHEEIALNLERIEAAKVERWQAKRGGKPTPTAETRPAKKGSPITPGKTTEAASGAPRRALTADERVQRAMQAAQESMRALAKAQ